MILKTSTIALCSSYYCPTPTAGLPALLSPSPPWAPCATSPPCKLSTRRPRGPENVLFSKHTCRDTRTYATLSDDRSRKPSDPAPPGWPSSRDPTPYEIFGQHRHSPYSKAKFYELVKIYHPDRHQHDTGQVLSHAVRLDRYRMVVAANEILSDPVKRREYNLYGAGWGGRRSMQGYYRQADRSWREEPGNASMNATWEDWERWYEERDGRRKRQQPVYMSNGLFVGLLCMFVVVGSMGQARRASTSSMDLVEVRDQKHRAIGRDLRQRQHEQALLSRHERVEHFIREREGWRLASASSAGSQQRSHSSSP
ncbi:hypothetical protein F4775DRAFT_464886 [Biscogniauxia sp. FL1348]|nr:hypothetical protein F4775DRAFT_464886 [Biscogniauxia sp. FL1348]